MRLFVHVEPRGWEIEFSMCLLNSSAHMTKKRVCPMIAHWRLGDQSFEYRLCPPRPYSSFSYSQFTESFRTLVISRPSAMFLRSTVFFYRLLLRCTGMGCRGVVHFVRRNGEENVEIVRQRFLQKRATFSTCGYPLREWGQVRTSAPCQSET